MGRLTHANHITAALLKWGSSELRDLPWRRASEPWHVLVSEVMLQQTSVVRVLPKFAPFIETFPTPQALADAPLGAALELWQGLGYPRRCRNLRDAATSIINNHGGVVPDTLDELLALPGVGPYTARAVLAFAFHHDVGVVDVNVSRVFSRLENKPMRSRELQEVADTLVPRGSSWEWNQVIMELGGRICTAQSPKCSKCPIRQWCLFFSQAQVSMIADPARLSGGASRAQPRFDGSDRQLRGRILKRVLQGGCNTDAIVSDIGIEVDRVRVLCLIDALIAEGLVVGDEGGFSAP